MKRAVLILSLIAVSSAFDADKFLSDNCAVKYNLFNYGSKIKEITCQNFQLTEQEAKHFEREHFSFGDSIKTIVFKDCELAALNDNVFSKFPGAKKITIENCKINLGWSKEEEKQNATHPAIEKVTITDSTIKNSVGSNAFAHLFALKELIIRNSDFEHKIIDGKLLEGSKALKILKITGCGIEDIDKNAFVNLSELEVLKLHTNKLKALHPTLLRNNRKLEIVDFSGNEIKEIPLNASFLTNYVFFPDNIQKLNLSHNLINHIENKNFKNMRKMYYLDLSHNNIDGLSDGCFDELFDDSGRIKAFLFENTLDLSYNSIKYIGRNTLFSRKPKYLTRLDLSHNKIEEVGALDNIYKLKFLDFSYNNIMKIDMSSKEKLKDGAILTGNTFLIE
ncbi:Tl.2 family protein [Megaselia abdita]